MSKKSISQWRTTITTHFPQLSQPQAMVLALWSLGMVLARSCALTAASLMLATVLKRKENSVRQRLREFCYQAEAKRGAKRQALVVEDCFVPLLRWVLSWWQSQQLALALDATTLGQRFVVLVVSVLYRGCAIPVAWVILPATEKHAWRGEWLRLLRVLRPAIPRQMTVLVLADRGLYARWLFRRIVRLGWHPLLRINAGTKFRPTASNRFLCLSSLVGQAGQRWSGQGTASVSQPLPCTLLACWEEGQAEPWFLLTDLPPEAGEAAWYGLRAWIEHGFKFIKRAGWQWHKTRMTDPERAARLWLAVAVATLWLLSVGGQADAAIADSTVPDLSSCLTPKGRSRRTTRLRLVSLFRRGWALILAALLTHARLPMGSFLPEPWPSFPSSRPSESFAAANATCQTMVQNSPPLEVQPCPVL